MKKKTRIALLVAAIALIIVFIYFAATGKGAKKEKAMEYTPGPYTDEQLNQINQENITRSSSLDALERICDVQYLDKGSPDQIAVVPGDTQVLVIHYDENGEQKSQALLSLSPPSEAFETLSTDDSINDVMTIDPNADYSFTYSGRNDTQKLSLHYTKDGFCVVVAYDSNNSIIGVEKIPLEK